MKKFAFQYRQVILFPTSLYVEFQDDFYYFAFILDIFNLSSKHKQIWKKILFQSHSLFMIIM